MPNAHRIAKQMGIRIMGRKQWGLHPGGTSLPSKTTWARKTIHDVAKAGELAGLPEHVYDVLGLFLLTETNKCQLYMDSILGVSKWALRHRITTAEVPFLYEAFSQIDLQAVRQDVLRHNIDQRAPQIAFLVAVHMREALEHIR